MITSRCLFYIIPELPSQLQVVVDSEKLLRLCECPHSKTICPAVSPANPLSGAPHHLMHCHPRNQKNQRKRRNQRSRRKVQYTRTWIATVEFRQVEPKTPTRRTCERAYSAFNTAIDAKLHQAVLVLHGLVSVSITIPFLLCTAKPFLGCLLV